MRPLAIVSVVLIGLLAVGCTPAPSSMSTPAAPTEKKMEEKEEMKTENARDIITGEIAYYFKKPEIKGYLARPADDLQHPGLILIHEWWGLNDNMRRNAQEFAKLGYVALAVDMYGGQFTTSSEDARRLAGQVRDDMPEAFKNLEYAVKYLQSQDQHVKAMNLASVGWCFGGGWSYQMAKNNLGVKASVIYYGRFNPEDDLAQMRATILGHFGEEDRGIKVDTVQEFQATLKTLNGNHEIYIYRNAGHAFANEGGDQYDEAAATLAWQRTTRFLEKTLQ